MSRIKIFGIISFFSLQVIFLYAGEMPFKVLPWNGYEAAVSLTYDDGDPIHLDVVIPEMSKRNLRGTFYLISDKLSRSEEWGKISDSGHEIGNHSVTHKRVAELDSKSEQSEVKEAKLYLQNMSGNEVLTFAYPFSENSSGLLKNVKKHNFIARGGNSGYYYMTPETEPDWFNVSSMMMTTDYAIETYEGWVESAYGQNAWIVFMIHAIEGSDWYQPIPKKTFLKLLDYLKQKEKKIWIAPFGEVGAYWKAQKVIESAKIKNKKNMTIVKWKKFANMPENLVLKIKVNDSKLRVFQEGSEIKKEPTGIYTVSFDMKELILKK